MMAARNISRGLEKSFGVIVSSVLHLRYTVLDIAITLTSFEIHQFSFEPASTLLL